MSQDNIALVKRWFDEVWNQRRECCIDELLTEESRCYDDAGPIIGPTGFRERQYAPFIAAFPDVKIEVEDAIGQGDQVVIRWVATGTHTGDGLGFIGSQKPVTIRGMTWIRLEHGKLMEGWQHSNMSDVFRTLVPG